MKIEVKNLGKISKGQFDLDKKFCVFVGYNNTGKTYLSQLLWSLSSFEHRIGFNGSEFISPIEIESDKKEIRLDEEMIEKVMRGFCLNVKETLVPNLFNVEAENSSIKNFSLEFIDGYITKIKDKKIKHIAINIGAEGGLISNYYIFSKKEGSFNISIEERSLADPLKLINILEIEKGFDSINGFTSNKSLSDILRASISRMILYLIFEDVQIPFFLPANRVFYPSYYKYIYSIAKEEKDRIDDLRLKKSETNEAIKSLSKRPYTKAMDDLIQKVYDLNKNSPPQQYHTDLLNELRDIIGGDIIIKSSEGIAPIEFYLKLDNGEELEMYMSSSSANQLTTLYLYFKYWASDTKNLLIIDEPEENLHPENQIKLLHILMKFANRDNRVLITTHSPMMAELVNNYANVSYLREMRVDVDSLIKDSTPSMSFLTNIKHSDFGVYFFDGKFIKDYEVGDYGAFFKDFQDAQDKIKDISNILKSNIYDNLNSNANKELL